MHLNMSMNEHLEIVCDTEAKMPTIRKTMRTINMRARRVSITAVISSRNCMMKYVYE